MRVSYSCDVRGISGAGAAATWKKRFGLHQLLAFLDRPEIAGGEALAGLLRNGNAGSNTASDHVIVLEEALAALPAPSRPDPAPPGDTGQHFHATTRKDSPSPHFNDGEDPPSI